MAEKLPPEKRLRPSAGSSASAGGGGGGGDSAAAPPPPPSPPREPSSSPPRSPSPPKPFTYDVPDAGSRGDGGGGHNPGAGAGSSGGGGRGGLRRPGSGGGGGARQKKKVRFQLPSDPSAGTSAGGGGGGGGGDVAAAPLPAPQPEPSSSRPPSPPLPDDDDDDDFFEDYGFLPDEDLDAFEKRSGWGSLFMSDPQVLCMDSHDLQNPPPYIGRQNCAPLITKDFFSLHHNWQQLLDGKKTYLRPPKNSSVAKDNLFVTPEPLEKALQCQELLSDFVRGAEENSIVQQKFKILSEHYVFIRRMRMDGSSFYRAFLFSYLENLGKMQCSQAEVTRLMECVARSRENFCHLHWKSVYFSNPEAFFSSVVSEFEHLVNSVANGLNADELYKRCLQEITSSRILCLLRLLTEVHIRTHHVDYGLQHTEALLFCIESVRPFDAEAGRIQMRALSNALGIPLHLALMDVTMKRHEIEVKCFDFFPQSESRVSTTSGLRSSIREYDLSSTTDKHPEHGRDDSNSIDHMPLVTLLDRIGQCDILYRK